MFQKLGVQLFTIRDFLGSEEEIRRSFRKLKELGYDQVQTCGCPISSYERFGELLREAELEVVGTHENFSLMLKDFDTSYRQHERLGTNHMGIGVFESAAAEGWEQFVADANRIGKKAAEKGGYFTYHNHCEEFAKLPDGRRPMDILKEELDPKNTAFVLDTYWIQYGGGDVRRWIEELSGRISVLHLKDMGIHGETPFYAEIGQGNLYWEGILDAAERAGVTYYVVEQDECPGDPFESLRVSSEYLHKHFMR